ncbi:hypothetical protein BH09BAC1_BH09BAC1_02160 [soil metagenome]
MKQINFTMALHWTIRIGFLAMLTVVGFVAQAQTTIAAWNGNSGYSAPFSPTSSHSSNSGARLNSNTSGVINTSVGDAQGQFYLSTGWDGGANSKSWSVSIVTTGFTGIKVSSKQRSTALGFTGWNGPGEFKLQYSLDNSTWVDVITTINPRDNWSSGNISAVSLPVACEDKAAVYLRWVMRSNVATQSSPGSFGSSAQSYIDDISIAGTYTAPAPTNTAPSISAQSFSIDENKPNGSVVGTVVATDAQSNPITYSITAGNTGGAFAIGSSTGQITVANVNALDYETTPVFSLTINASDGTLSNSATITITLNDINENLPINNPPVLVDASFTIDEDSPMNLIPALFALYPSNVIDADGDTIQEIKFTVLPVHGTLITGGQPVVANQEYDRSQMSIQYIPAQNYNGADSFKFNISDGTSYAASEATANIMVSGLNDSPTDVSLSASSVDENASVGSIVGTLSATDADAGDTHYYQLISGAGDESNGNFTISGDKLLVANNINFESTSILNIRLQAVDGMGESFQKTFTLDVNDKNDAPSSLSLTNNIVDEHQGAGTFVGILLTADEDANDTHTLTLVSGNGDADNANFSVSNNILVTNAVLDFNTQQQHAIRVRSTDAGGAFKEANFVINVKDVNQTATAISISNASIAENNAIGAFIGYLSATDPDAADTHTFTLVNGSGDADNASFQIVNGDLNAAISFDFETKSSYSIRVSATDAAGASFEQVLIISILDAVDAPIGITISNVAIDENQPIGSVVGTLTTAVSGQPTGHTYTFANGQGDVDNGLFAIDGNGVVTASAINFEVKSSYSIRLRSTDSAGGFTEEVFAIAVNDVNEAPTSVTINLIGIGENAAIGTAVGFISVTDEDLADVHTISLAPGYGATDNAKFSIQANKLQVNANLDYEAQSIYTVRLRATDNGGEFIEKDFIVTITNVNEAPTAITLSANTFAENNAAGAILATLGIVDEDRNDSHSFSLVAGNGDADNASFYISGDMLIANMSFNYEVQNSFNIRIAGTDLGGLKTEETFTITITDVIEAPRVRDLVKQVNRNSNTYFSGREFGSAYSQEEGRTLKQIKIMTLPMNGSVLFMNTPVVAGQTFLLAEFSNLSYAPMLGYVGTDAFTFASFDGMMYSAEATYTMNVVNTRQVGTAVTSLNGATLHIAGTAIAGSAKDSDGTTSVEEMQLEISTFSSYPNPSKGITNITFELPVSMNVTLEVYDLMGRKVAVLADGLELNGKQTIQWNGGDAGQYICHMVATSANGNVITKTINLMQIK